MNFPNRGIMTGEDVAFAGLASFGAGKNPLRDVPYIDKIITAAHCCRKTMTAKGKPEDGVIAPPATSPGPIMPDGSTDAGRQSRAWRHRGQNRPRRTCFLRKVRPPSAWRNQPPL